MPARPDLDGMCADCFRILRVETRLTARKMLLTQLAINDQELAKAVERLDAVPPGAGKPSILHKCICGFADTSYIQVDIHVAEWEDPEHHRHEMRQIVTAKPAAQRRSERVASEVRMEMDI